MHRVASFFLGCAVPIVFKELKNIHSKITHKNKVLKCRELLQNQYASPFKTETLIIEGQLVESECCSRRLKIALFFDVDPVNSKEARVCMLLSIGLSVFLLGYQLKDYKH